MVKATEILVFIKLLYEPVAHAELVDPRPPFFWNAPSTPAVITRKDKSYEKWSG